MVLVIVMLNVQEILNSSMVKLIFLIGKPPVLQLESENMVLVAMKWISGKLTLCLLKLPLILVLKKVLIDVQEKIVDLLMIDIKLFVIKMVVISILIEWDKKNSGVKVLNLQ